MRNIVLLALIGGCAPAAEEPEDVAAAPASTPPTLQTFPTDTACSTILPVDQIGRRFVYFRLLDGSGWTRTVTYSGQEDYHGELAWRVDAFGSAQLGQGLYEDGSTTWYRCDEDGVWELGFESWSTTSFGTTTAVGPPVSGFYAERATQPGLLAPPDVELGGAWDYVSVAEVLDESGEPTGDEDEDQGFYEVIASKDRTLELGHATVLTIQQNGSWEPITRDYVRGLGRVAYAGYELVEYEL